MTWSCNAYPWGWSTTWERRTSDTLGHRARTRTGPLLPSALGSSARRLADDELVADPDVLHRPLHVAEAVVQCAHRLGRDRALVRADGAQRRRGVAGVLDVVEPDDRDVVGHAHTLLVQGPQCPQRELVVEAEDGIEPSVALEQLDHRRGTVTSAVSGDLPGEVGVDPATVGGERLLVARPPDRGDARLGGLPGL